ncbi:DoxX family protein [Nocardia sp. AB354]|uniref:DoxX family protein n=1 Tax=Nocardia sp. AB354 TaxID=3413283 RepID=UPI003C2988C0
MNMFLWVLQGCLAALVVLSGVGKLAQPKDILAKKFPWMQDVSEASIRLIGIVEVVGELG